MITALLRGGLGNQMFEYATGLAAARRNNTRFLLDTTILRDRFPLKERTYRDYSLDVFTLGPEFTTLSELSARFPIPGLWVAIDLALIKMRDMLGLQKLVKEKKDHIFDPDALDAGENVFLWGFWQVPKYFAGVEAEIRAAFRFRQPLMGDAAVIAQEIANTNAVALHVRRADYLLAKYAGTYGDTNLEYYEKALAHIKKNVKDPAFFVFSDDIAWCRENLKLPAGAKITFIERSSEGPKASFHLHLMSLCKHNIIANSSYSWWGAWLNQNPGKIVIAPKQWIVGAAEEEIIPPEWVKI